MSSAVVNWSGRWESDSDAAAFEEFIESLIAANPETIRMTRAAATVFDAVLSKHLFGPEADVELIAMHLGGTVIDRGESAGDIAVDKIALRGYEIGLYTGINFHTLSFQSVHDPEDDLLHGVLVECWRDRLGSNRVTGPSVSLRYLLEQWIDPLLGATRLFFLPNLVYFHNGYIPGFDNLLEAARSFPEWTGWPPSAADRAALRARALPAVVQGLAELNDDAQPLAAYDAVQQRAANFVTELCERGLSREDAEYVVSQTDPEFMDEYLSPIADESPRTIHDLVAMLRARAAEESSPGFSIGDILAQITADVIQRGKEPKEAKKAADEAN